MYGFETLTDNRTNRQLMEERTKLLRRKNCERYALKDKSNSPLLKDTAMQERKTCLTYNAESLDENNAVLFTGQCLLKKEENLECPVTLQDAIECERLKTLLEKYPLPAVCMYPDSVYREFIKGWSGNDANEKDIDVATEIYLKFRRKVLPEVEHIRTSELQSFGEPISKEELEIARKQIRKIYGGRILTDGQEHPLQRVLLDYGLKTIHITSKMGYGAKNIVIFAEPDEICSVHATAVVANTLGMNIKIGLLGQLPVPSLDFLLDREIIMYSANRKSRIYLSESDADIRRKLETESDFCAVSTYLSPLTTREQLEYAKKSRNKGDMVEILMEQIVRFRKYLE